MWINAYISIKTLPNRRTALCKGKRDNNGLRITQDSTSLLVSRLFTCKLPVSTHYYISNTKLWDQATATLQRRTRQLQLWVTQCSSILMAPGKFIFLGGSNVDKLIFRTQINETEAPHTAQINGLTRRIYAGVYFKTRVTYSPKAAS